MSLTGRGKLVQQSQLEDLIRDTLPVEEIVVCFGYGSGVFSQALAANDGRDQDNLIDLIVVVNDSLKFHEQNYEQNPTHYWTPPSWLVPPSDLPQWFTNWQRQQESWFSQKGQNPGVYFNVTPRIKYGVVQAEDFVRDLEQWEYLYLAGRLHKPTLALFQIHETGKDGSIGLMHQRQQETILHAQNNNNLPAALSAALWMLSSSSDSSSPSCSELQLYYSIAGLSYQGDFRMKVAAEDPKKVQRLVESSGQLERFQHLYQPTLKNLEAQGILQKNAETISWDKTKIQMLRQILPSSLNTNKPLEPQLAGRVAASARIQSVKGIVTAGPTRAMKYALRKLSKGLAFLK